MVLHWPSVYTGRTMPTVVFITIVWYGHLEYRSLPMAAAVLISSEDRVGRRWNYATSFACIFAAVVFAFWGRL